MLYRLLVIQDKKHFVFGLESNEDKVNNDFNIVLNYIKQAYDLSDEELDVSFSKSEKYFFNHKFEVTSAYSIKVISEIGLSDVMTGYGHNLIKMTAPDINSKQYKNSSNAKV